MTREQPGEERAASGPGFAALPLKVLLPGASQWVWGERERGAVFAGSFTTAAATSAFLWGTPLSLALLAVAFATHVAATTDVLSRRAFPGFGRKVVWSAAVVGLGLGIYTPFLTAATLIAWPGLRSGAEEAEGFLVNCWAYHLAAPRRDELVWYRPTPWAEPRVGRVVAGQGQEVEWDDGVMRVDGRIDRRTLPTPALDAPKALAYRVPDGHVLVRVEGGPTLHRPPVEGLAVVAREQVLGRAWAQLYPIRERRLL